MQTWIVLLLCQKLTITYGLTPPESISRHISRRPFRQAKCLSDIKWHQLTCLCMSHLLHFISIGWLDTFEFWVCSALILVQYTFHPSTYIQYIIMLFSTDKYLRKIRIWQRMIYLPWSLIQWHSTWNYLENFEFENIVRQPLKHVLCMCLRL